MRCPKLSPLQARFAASLAATLFLFLLYLFLSSPRLAYAIDVDSLIPDDHNHPRSLGSESSSDTSGLSFQPTLLSNAAAESLKARDIAKRAPDGVRELQNNDPHRDNLNMGETHNWMFPKEALAGPKSPLSPGLPSVPWGNYIYVNNERMGVLEQRDDTHIKRGASVYISVTTCVQPLLSATQDSRDGSPPQLQLYISQSGTNQKPGPGVDDQNMIVKELDGGYVSAELDADSDVYVGVAAPNNPRYSGRYNYEVAVSIDSYFHYAFQNASFLFFVDGDTNAALFQTGDLVDGSKVGQDDDWMRIDPPPFTMFAHSLNDKSILGVQKSYCGLSNNAQLSKNTKNVETQMTERGVVKTPKEQILAKNLNSSSSYYGFLAMEGNSSSSGKGVVGGGGMVWKAMNFSTKTGK